MIAKVIDRRLIEAELARRSHLEFMQFLWQRRNPFLVGHHTEEACAVIDQAIEDYRNGISSFLAIKIPFRHGKSDIVSRYLPANFIGKFPDDEVIVAAYASPLVRTFSRFCRNIMLDPLYQYVYPGIGMAKDQRSVDEWGIEGHHGLTSWLGIGGSITGKGGNCFPAGTMIKTDEGDVDIARLYKLYSNYKVLTNNNGKLEYRRICATHKRKSKRIVKITTNTGRSFTCTEDHRIYSCGKYVSAGKLIQGQDITVCSDEMRLLPEDILERKICGKKGFEAKLHSKLLFKRMFGETSRNKKHNLLCNMWKAKVWEKAFKILFGKLQDNSVKAEKVKKKSLLQILWRNVLSQKQKVCVLFKELSKRCPFTKNDWKRKLSLQEWPEQIKAICRNAAINNRTGYQLCFVWSGETNRNIEGEKQVSSTKNKLTCSPHRFDLPEQYSRELNAIVQKVSHKSTQIFGTKTEKVALVQRLCEGEIDVYDIQVEKTHNYFANNVLVHNCIIIDDFFKNRAAAESEVVREYVWESVTNDILTRRAPVSIVIILATPWHVDDVFGRIEVHRKADPDFPEFKEVKLPAFSDDYPAGTLFPERFSKQWYYSQKAILGPYGFAGLMQCDPVARGGNIFEVDQIKYYDGDPPEGLVWCRGWDLASKEKERVDEDPDFTDGVKLGARWLTLPDGETIPEIYIDDVIDGRWAAPMRNKTIKSATIGDGYETVVAIESFAAYRDAYEEISKALHGIRKVKGLQLPGNKVAKASVLEAPMAAGNVYIRRAKWNEKFLKQFREFPGAAHDDIVDATVVAYEGLDPHEKRVWPQFQGRHIIKLDIDWNHVKSNVEGTLHYAGVWQKEDLSVWIVLCLWDAHKGFLFAYDAFMCDNPIPAVVIPKLISRMRLKTHKSEAIVCNKLMWETSGYTKNTGLQYRRDINGRGITANIKEAFNYDEFASIIEIGQLFDIDRIFVESSAKSLVLQLMSWVTIERGRHVGAKPDTEDDGWARALCLVVSELRRKDQWTRVVKPILADYANAELVDKIYSANKIK